MIIPPADRLQITQEYYFSVKLQEVARLRAEGRDILNIAIGNPDMPPSEATIEAMARASRDPGNHGYQPYRGIPELRRAIGEWYHRIYGVGLDPDKEILPLIGSKEGITHISLAFLNPGDKVLVPELGYPAYRAVSEMVGAGVIEYPLLEDRQWQPDFEALEAMDLNRVKIMWINFPHMPTGAPASRESFSRLVDFAARKGILICHDNPYSLVLNEGSPLSLLSLPGAGALALELNSMSKSHNMAGWRIGWVAGAAGYLDQVIKIKSNVDSGMFKAVQLAAIEAFNNTDEWHRERNERYRKRREWVYKILDLLHCSYSLDQVGLFIWGKISSETPSSEWLTEHLLQHYRIFVSPGFIFGPKGHRYIRISLCENERLLEQAALRLKNFSLHTS